VAQEVAKRIGTVEASQAEDVSEETVQVAEASEAEEQDSSDQVEDALENVQVEDAAVINNNESSSEAPSSLRDRFAKTFKESVKISY
jgi:succinate dehydrogenase/fumarate reductase flavoprotein subunit